MTSPELNRVRQIVRAMLDEGRMWVLAISGGIDSMCLLDAASAALPGDRLVVAHFDHATGEHSRSAAQFVEQHARKRGLTFRFGRATTRADSEAEWRAMRWAFLRNVRKEIGASVVTAHTRDDQVETVLMRVMRDAGARGIAGLFVVPDGIVRPFLEITRAELETYAREARIDWMEDPTNVSSRYLRNRVRHQLLPAMRQVDPALDRDLLDLARRAAEWRRQVEAVVETHVSPVVRDDNAGLDVDSSTLTGYSQPMLAALWPAIVARAGIALDHRGTRRLLAFTMSGKVGSRMQLSGGWEVVRSRHRFEVRPVRSTVPEPIQLEESTRWGRWWFRRVDAARPSDAWTAWLPAEDRITVRRWRPGDTMIPAPGRSPRKVKRLLSAAGVTGHDRESWPVVLAGDEIVWIPGVRRTDAATDRSGRPTLTYRCEFDDR